MKSNKTKFNNASICVKQVIGNMELGQEFHGYDLKNKCVEINADLKNMYVDTFLRIMRKYCHYDYELINKPESLYKKITPRRQVLHQETTAAPAPKYAAEIARLAEMSEQNLFDEA